MDTLMQIERSERPLRRFGAMRPRDPDRIEAQIASTPEMMRTVQVLRHDSYVAQGFLDVQPDGLFSDVWDNRLNSLSVLVFCKGEPVASVRATILDLAADSPEFHATVAMDGYEDDVRAVVHGFRVKDRPARALEMSRLVRHPSFERDADIVFGLYRMTFYLVLKFQADIILSTVRSHHMPFYRRLGFEKITDPRPYPRLKFQVGLMACFQPSYEIVQRTVPIIDQITEDDTVFAPFVSGSRVRVFAEMDNPKATVRPGLFTASHAPRANPFFGSLNMSEAAALAG